MYFQRIQVTYDLLPNDFSLKKNNTMNKMLPILKATVERVKLSTFYVWLSRDGTQTVKCVSLMNLISIVVFFIWVLLQILIWQRMISTLLFLILQIWSKIKNSWVVKNTWYRKKNIFLPMGLEYWYQKKP